MRCSEGTSIEREMMRYKKFRKALKITERIFNDQLEKTLVDESRTRITEFLYSIAKTNTFHTLLVGKSLHTLTEEVFECDEIRAFVLTVTDKLAIELNALFYEVEYGSGTEVIVSLLVSSLSHTHQHAGELTLVPEPISNLLELSAGDIENVLTENFWLVALILYIIA